MKRLLLSIISIILISLNVWAQNTPRKGVKSQVIKVPENIETSFKTAFSDVTALQWIKNHNGNYSAKFTHSDGRVQTSEFNGEGKIVRSVIVYPMEAIQSNHLEAIKGVYADASVSTFTRYEPEGITPYYKVKIVTADATPKEILMSDEGTITE